MKVKNEKLLAEYRGVQSCWSCGLTRPCQAHHLVTKGMGGARRADVRLNLAALCLECHNSHHGGHSPSTEELVGKVAAKNGVQPADVEDAMQTIKWGR